MNVPKSKRPAGSMMNLGDAMRLATDHQSAGRLREAESVLREILKVVPKHAGAIHLLGVIAHQSGQYPCCQHGRSCLSAKIKRVRNKELCREKRAKVAES